MTWKHGTSRGYVEGGCREDCCRRAHVQSIERLRLRKLRGEVIFVDPEPSRRRVQALARIGWSMQDIGDRIGVDRSSVRQALLRTKIRPETALAITKVYEALENTEAPRTDNSIRIRRAAERKGWHPPLDWEDIDAGILFPKEKTGRKHDQVDEVAVERAIQYRDFSLTFTRAEKEEITRRWLADGRTQNSLEALTGWNVARYRPSTSTAEEAPS